MDNMKKIYSMPQSMTIALETIQVIALSYQDGGPGIVWDNMLEDNIYDY